MDVCSKRSWKYPEAASYKFIKNFTCYIGYLLVFIPLIFLEADIAHCAAIATAGQDDGYSGRILDKIAAKWKPPKQLVGSHRLKLILSIDGEGELMDCKVLKASGLDALDVSACAAARAAAPFGSPPYGMPATVHFSFWSGGLDSRVPVHEDKAHVNPIHAQMAADNARFANERAQARAEAAAKSSGKKLNADAQKNTPEAKKNANPEKQSHAGALPQEKKKEAQIASQNLENTRPASHELVKAQTAKTTAPVNDSTSPLERYLSRITWNLRNAMYVPAQAKPGTYHATVQIDCDAKGQILSSDLIKSSGDPLVDKYVMQGIKRAKKILPPPPEAGNKFDLTFTLVRK